MRARLHDLLVGFYDTLALDVYGPERGCGADRYVLEPCRPGRPSA
jgi:hypothetical protein